MAEQGLADGEQSAMSDQELGQTMAESEQGVEAGSPGAPTQACEQLRTVYVRKVRGPARAKVGDTVRYEAYEFYIKEEDRLVGPEELCAGELAKVKWTVIVDGDRNDQDVTGDVLEFEVPEEMGGTMLDEKQMHVHPYMNSPAQSIKVATLVDDGKIIIVIDPGHGDIFRTALDPGAVAREGGQVIAMEKDLALDVSKLFMAELLKLELVTEVYLTRDKDLDDMVRPRLSWRTQIAHDRGADYLISIHLDAIDGPSANGQTIFYKGGNAEGQKLAEAMSAAYTLIRSRGVKTKSLHITNRFRGSAGGTLVELGFISNPSDRTVISTQGAEIARQLAQGVNDYLESVLGAAEG